MIAGIYFLIGMIVGILFENFAVQESKDVLESYKERFGKIPTMCGFYLSFTVFWLPMLVWIVIEANKYAKRKIEESEDIE